MDTSLETADSRVSGAPIEQRILIGKRWIDRLHHEITIRQSALEQWSNYVRLLEQVREIEKDLQVAGTNGHVHITRRTAQSLPGVRLLVYYAFQQPQYDLPIKSAATWLVTQRFSDDSGSAERFIRTTVTHRDDLFERLDRGVYKLTAKGQKVGAEVSSQIDAQAPLELPPSEEA